MVFLRMAIALGFFACPWAMAAGHDHLNAGAFDSRPGAPLYFANGDRFAAESGYVLPFSKVSQGTQAGWHRGGITFTALASTVDYGGPAFGHAAPGAHLELVLESLEGPAGAAFGFWEAMDGEEGTEITLTVPTGERTGTGRFPLSETPGEAGDDPYGHVHGRVFTLDREGFYVLGLRLVDTSTNGEGGGPLHPPSALYRMNLQAGVSLARVEWVPDPPGGLRLWFAALAGGTYRVQRATALSADAAWEDIGDAVVGDDRLHAMEVPAPGAAGFFRLHRKDGGS